MSMLRKTLFAALIALAAPPVAAQEASAPPMLNTPNAGWNVYGPGQTHKARKDGAVQGGSAMRVAIPAKPANAWDVARRCRSTRRSPRATS